MKIFSIILLKKKNCISLILLTLNSLETNILTGVPYKWNRVILRKSTKLLLSIKAMLLGTRYVVKVESLQKLYLFLRADVINSAAVEIHKRSYRQENISPI